MFDLEAFISGVHAFDGQGNEYKFFSFDNDNIYYPLVAKPAGSNIGVEFTKDGLFVADGTRPERNLVRMAVPEEVEVIDPRQTGAKIDDCAVNHPLHYTSHPSGVECITVIEHMGFNLGNAIKYIWRADLKGSEIEDLKKARWYIERELQKRGEK